MLCVVNRLYDLNRSRGSLHLQISIVNSTCDRCTSFLEKMDRFFIHPGVGNSFLQPHIASQESYSDKLVRRVDPIAFFINFFNTIVVLRSGFYNTWCRHDERCKFCISGDCQYYYYFASLLSILLQVIVFQIISFEKSLPKPSPSLTLSDLLYFYRQTEVFEINS